MTNEPRGPETPPATSSVPNAPPATASGLKAPPTTTGGPEPLRAISRGPETPRRVRPGTILRLALVALLFTAAPTVGDIGSCGQSPDDLDPIKFFTAKETLDCARCRTCNILTDACTRACEPALDQTDFPRSCYPLVHDGEVCLRALSAASCADYLGFMADVSPTIPTECNFCPPCDDGGLPDGSPALAPCE